MADDNKNLLILSFIRRYGRKDNHGLTPGFDLEKPRSNMASYDDLHDMLQVQRSIGGKTANEILLAIPSQPTGSINRAMNRITELYLPDDLNIAKDSPQQLAQTLENQYPEAYAEYKKWVAAPEAYLQLEHGFDKQGQEALDSAKRGALKYLKKQVDGVYSGKLKGYLAQLYRDDIPRPAVGALLEEKVVDAIGSKGKARLVINPKGHTLLDKLENGMPYADALQHEDVKAKESSPPVTLATLARIYGEAMDPIGAGHTRVTLSEAKTVLSEIGETVAPLTDIQINEIMKGLERKARRE